MWTDAFLGGCWKCVRLNNKHRNRQRWTLSRKLPNNLWQKTCISPVVHTPAQISIGTPQQAASSCRQLTPLINNNLHINKSQIYQLISVYDAAFIVTVVLSHRNSVDKDAAAVTIYKRRTNRLMTFRYASLGVGSRRCSLFLFFGTIICGCGSAMRDRRLKIGS